MDGVTGRLDGPAGAAGRTGGPTGGRLSGLERLLHDRHQDRLQVDLRDGWTGWLDRRGRRWRREPSLEARRCRCGYGGDRAATDTVLVFEDPSIVGAEADGAAELAMPKDNAGTNSAR